MLREVNICYFNRVTASIKKSDMPNTLQYYYKITIWLINADFPGVKPFKKKKSILIFHVRNALSKHFCKHQKKKIQTVPLPDPGAYIV